MGITSEQERELRNHIHNYITAVGNYSGNSGEYRLAMQTKEQMNEFISSLVEPEKKTKYVYSYSVSSLGNSFIYSGIIRLDKPITGGTGFAAVKELLSARHKARINVIHSFSFLGKHEIG